MGTQLYAVNDEKRQVVEIGTTWHMATLDPTSTLDEMETQVRTALEDSASNRIYGHPDWAVIAYSKALFELQPFHVVTEDENEIDTVEHYIMTGSIYYHPKYQGNIGKTLGEHFYGTADPTEWPGQDGF